MGDEKQKCNELCHLRHLPMIATGEQSGELVAVTATVITVSDSASRGEREDVSGPEACRLLREAGYVVAPPVVVHLVVEPEVPVHLRSRQSFSAAMARISPSPEKPTYERVPRSR